MMLKDTLLEMAENPWNIKVHGKGLLYSVDMRGEIESLRHQTQFMLSGAIRFGVLKSQGLFCSIYEWTGDIPTLKDHQIEFPNLGFTEHYFWGDKSFFFQKGNRPKQNLRALILPITEPLPLIFKLVKMQEADGVHRGHLLVGGKQRPYSFIQKKNKFRVTVNEKELFSGEIGHQAVQVSLPKFKVKLLIEKN